MRIASNSFFPGLAVTGVRAAFLVALGLLPLLSPAAARAADPEAIAIAAAPDPAPAAKPADMDMDKSVSAIEDKVSENAKSLVKRLDNSSDAMTLEDLNSARQTVARIEAMIDVEKHLVELDKLRNERGGHGASASTLAAAIPASALAPMPPPPHMAERPKSSVSGSEVTRISGTEGRYAAVIRFEGEQRSVRAGDQLGGGASVRWISSSAVGIEENGAIHILRIKNVDAIYSAMR